VSDHCPRRMSDFGSSIVISTSSVPSFGRRIFSVNVAAPVRGFH
jgi:hypothetical protein